MRPRVLKITAFGPYAGEQVIDFSLLDDANMFLIHGPTGGGKTTILDAMCYALYGETNGGERSGESMRSKFAAPETITEIEFIFSLGRREYKIIRRPQYEREAKRGSGKVKVNSEVELYKKEEDTFTILSSRYNEVSEKIGELLHFNVGQFRQVIMIAQNKFRELLTVSSKERQAILQDIFETGIYQEVEKKLEHRQSHFKDQIKEKQMTYDYLMQSIEPQEHEKLKDYIATKVLKNAPDVCEVLGGLNEEKNSRLKIIEGQQQETIKILSDYQQKLGQATQKYNQAKERDTLKIELEALAKEEGYYKEVKGKIIFAEKAMEMIPIDQSIEDIKQALEINLKEMQEREEQLKLTIAKIAHTKQLLEDSKEVPIVVDQLKKEYSVLESYMPKMDSLTHNLLQKEILNKKLEESETRLSKVLCQLDQIRKAIIEAEMQLNTRQQVQNDLAINLIEQKDLQFVLDKKLLIANKEVEKKRLLKAYQMIKKETDEQADLLKEATKEYNDLFEAFMLNQAGELAQTLRDDSPCPVCGSLNHPQKAVLVTTRVTRELLNEKEKDNKKIENKVAQKREELATVVEQGKGLKQMIEGYEGEIRGKEHITLEIKQQLDERVSQLQAQLKTLEEVQKSYGIQKEQLKNLEAEKETLNKLMEGQKLELNEVETKIKEVQKDFPKALNSKEALCDKLHHIKERYSKLEEDHKLLIEEKEKLNQLRVRDEFSLEEKRKTYGQLKKQKEEKEVLFKKALLESDLGTRENYEEGKKLVATKNQLKEAYDVYNQKMAFLTAQVKDLQNKTQDFKIEDLEFLQKEHEVLINRSSALSLEKQEVTHFIKKHEKLQGDIKELYKLSNELIEKQAIIDKISLLAKGKNKRGLSFERYIQSSIFEEVLKSANKKLKPMTQGRYELYRTDDMLRANAQAGLDIGIMDYYSQETRSVTTLSGGESFMAALALALGLAEVVQRLAGATPLDAMFIDEGFGSLDEEALELAIKTLLNIQDTGRLIGIISHVKELKEQIPVRLEITSDTRGSKAIFKL